jgi:hypothetical protein
MLVNIDSDRTIRQNILQPLFLLGGGGGGAARAAAPNPETGG